MEINYNLIIKYLVTKKNTFASKKHILLSSDLFPNKFKDLFQNKFYRYGINQSNAFYNSLLTLLNKDFIMYNSDEEIYEVKQLLKYTQDTNMKSLVNLLQINILFFDFKNETVELIHCGTEKCNPYKSTVLIAKFDEFYEPIMCEVDNKKIFSYNDLIIKKIYQSENIEINEDINKLVDEFLPLNEKTVITNEENTTFIKFTEEKKFTENELNKMKKDELEKILDEKNIKINVSKTLKKDIIKLILE